MNRQMIAATLTAAGMLAATNAFAACDNCGTVTDVRTVTKEGEATGGGAVLGGVVGGVLGHQIGSGRGNPRRGAGVSGLRQLRHRDRREDRDPAR